MYGCGKLPALAPIRAKHLLLVAGKTMPQLAPVTLETSLAAQNEHEYVHSVYDSIADHFSQTRYKPWPLIAAFLSSLAPGSIGLDSGTGNGKYLPFSADGSAYMVGLDRSLNLLKIARRAGGKDRDVVLGDALGFGWRRHAFVCDTVLRSLGFGVDLRMNERTLPSRLRRFIICLLRKGDAKL